MKREAGTGPLRIGKTLELSEDLYAMFFASNLSHEYIHYHKLKIDGKLKPVSEMDESEKKAMEKEMQLLEYTMGKERSNLFVKTVTVFVF